MKAATGVGLIYDVFRFGFGFTKNVNDPTALHIPFFSPNKEKRLFNMLEHFRFEDGTVLDFRGDSKNSSNGRSGLLANSNERRSKGFAHTFKLAIGVGPVGQYKLDWIFVKSYIEEPRNSNGPYRFAPHAARTMNDVNEALEEHLSDHGPITVTLPFAEQPVPGGDQ